VIFFDEKSHIFKNWGCELWISSRDQRKNGEVGKTLNVKVIIHWTQLVDIYVDKLFFNKYQLEYILCILD